MLPDLNGGVGEQEDRLIVRISLNRDPNGIRQDDEERHSVEQIRSRHSLPTALLVVEIEDGVLGLEDVPTNSLFRVQDRRRQGLEIGGQVQDVQGRDFGQPLEELLH